MSTSTSLSLRAILKSATARSGMDLSARLVTGATPAAKTMYVAAVAHSLPNGSVLYVVPSDAELEQSVADVGFFLAALEGLSDVATERAIRPFPSHEVDPYRGLAPHIGVTSSRARALHGLAAGDVRVVVASAASLLPRVSSPERLLRASVDLRLGMELAPADLAALLVDAGFTREDPADQHGEFAVRGGIVDIYPAGTEQPVRVEYIGDTIESLRTYDPGTQRSTRTIDQIAIVPLQDVLSDAGRADRMASVFDYLALARTSRLIVSERDEVEAAAEKLAEQVWRSYETMVGATGDSPGLNAGTAEDPTDLETAATDDVTGAGRDRAGLGSGARRTPSGTAAVPPPNALFAGLDVVRAQIERSTVLEHLALDRPVHEAESPAHSGKAVAAARCQPTVEFAGRIPDWVAEIRRHRNEGGTTLFVAASPGRAERTIELLKEYEVFASPVERAEDARYSSVLVAIGQLTRGFHLLDAGLHIYAEADVFEEDRRASERRRSATKAFLSDLRDLKINDLVVHIDHGIGRFVGLRQIGVGDGTPEFLELRYAGDDKLFVPVERLDLIQKYTGATRPPVDRLGGTTWERAKTRVKKAMRDMAGELLKLYAARKAVAGHAFAPDSHWQQEFEDAFEYELTPDQQSAIADIKRDMESSTPMDRLLCGDVGYGKTEVAMRAAFKAVMDGKQVAFLAPTTVLAFQHRKTLKERFAGFPVRIDMVSRFRTKVEQKAVVTDLAAGKVDIIVGTHRLLSKDVEFRDLGLLVVDEEQRFGVAHKEKIKQLRRKIDVLTMSATPIPRTLNMSLVGIRDMSIIETPPKDRLSIQTNVVRFDQEVIRRAVRNEMARNGQIYFVHNRVESIFSIGGLIQRLVPEARVVVGHGQMGEDQLERAMLDFVERKFDVLLATTIVENGLDIPNANTIIINRADRYGLSQLYQLRGRVGRSDRPAYAFLLVPPRDNLSPVAKKRLAAIKEFSDLGSGFRVAALDLEIRGAGNLLGGEQSGQIEAVGFEMYMKLLEETVRELKGEELVDDTRANVNLRVDLKIDESYVPDMNQRLMLYRKVAAARADEEIDRVLEEAIDRYGPLPASVLNLADYGRIRVMADRLGIETIDREGRVVVLKFGSKARVEPARVLALIGRRQDLRMVPPSALKLELTDVSSPEVKAKTAQRSQKPPVKPLVPGRRGDRYGGLAPSWWTARAKTGEVTGGFSKTEILRPEKDNPRAPGGVFERVGGVLSELLEQV